MKKADDCKHPYQCAWSVEESLKMTDLGWVYIY